MRTFAQFLLISLLAAVSFLPGRAAFAAGPADSYLARAKIDERVERSEGQFDLSSYEATYVFQVFNRRQCSVSQIAL